MMAGDTTLAALEARLAKLEDVEAVRTTWLDYCTQIDLADYARLGDVFAEDAELEIAGLTAAVDGTYHGRRSIIDDFYRRTAGPADGPPGSGKAMTGHLCTNMRIEVDSDEATTLGYFFEIVDDDLALIGTYQHRLRREPDRWRFTFKRIVVRYRARLEANRVKGSPLSDVVARPVGGHPGIADPGR
jgi:hypothetical protein